ncbi:MAG: hypothetical protein ACHQJ6_08860 [Candidatus Berkiellales bacterium]
MNAMFRKKIKGFGLLEVLFSLILFSLIIFGSLSTALQALYLSRSSFDKSQALFYGEGIANVIQTHKRIGLNEPLVYVKSWEKLFCEILPPGEITIQSQPNHSKIEISLKNKEKRECFKLKWEIKKDGQIES